MPGFWSTRIAANDDREIPPTAPQNQSPPQMQTTKESIPVSVTGASPTFNLYLLGCALIAALGGLLFGFDTAVISGTTDALRSIFSLSDSLLGFTVASALIGTIIGSLGAGRPTSSAGAGP